ncbi:hypothetical protein LCGC14_2289800 [marine sediment metagenome]|uniref:Uncharacterized protein n=1 Tax=marine sediment metagenome TaxID=412755 RepID=A0A0F9FLT5_9ZZZZ
MTDCTPLTRRHRFKLWRSRLWSRHAPRPLGRCPNCKRWFWVWSWTGAMYCSRECYEQDVLLELGTK